MKLILLRHEKRDLKDPRFYTPLLPEGKRDALLLVDKLNQYNIDVIYSSPFLRTLETIFPYVYYNNKYINVELGIMEYIHNPIFLLGDWYHDVSLINNNEIKKHINWSYESIVSEIDFNLLEEEKDLENRLIKFFNEMLIKDKDKTVLIVSHEGVINKIKDLYLIKTNMKEKFPMGHFEIYELI